MRLLVFVAAGMLLVGLLLAFRIAFKSYWGERSDFVRSPSTEISRHPERLSMELREIAFGAEGQPRLAGWYAPARSGGAVILVHGTGADRSSLLPETKILSAAGFGVLAVDLPGQGASEGKTLWGVPERRAICAAVDWLSERPEVQPDRIGALGFSMGAYVLTQACVEDPRLRAVVLVGCPTDVIEQNWVASRRWWLLSQLPTYWALRASGMPLDMMPKDIIGAIAPRPVLIVGGEFDHAVPPYMARQLYAAAADPKELWIVPGGRHGDYVLTAPREYGPRLVEFFGRTLLS